VYGNGCFSFGYQSGIRASQPASVMKRDDQRMKEGEMGVVGGVFKWGVSIGFLGAAGFRRFDHYDRTTI
jgi:hypothetical protein